MAPYFNFFDGAFFLIRHSDAPTTAAFSTVRPHLLSILSLSIPTPHPINHREHPMPGNIANGSTGKPKRQIIHIILIHPLLRVGLLIHRTMLPGLTEMLCVPTHSLAPERNLRRRTVKLTNFGANFHFFELSRSRASSCLP